MAAAADSYRLAIAALGIPQPLRHALADLRSSALSEDNLCLAGVPESIQRIRETGAADGFLGALLDVQPLPLMGDLPVVATSNRLMTSIKAEIRGASGHCWLSPQMRAGLVDRMVSGDVVLVAGPLTAKQLADATRVLLRHSKHHVQSHTFVKPGEQ